MNKIYLFLVFSILTTIGMAQEKIKQTAGRDQLGTFAPKFAELNDDVLFGEVWSLSLIHIWVILNGLGKDAAMIISRINGFTYVQTEFDYYTGELKVVKTKAYSDGPRAKVNCYGADDVREGVAIMWKEDVDVSITGNSTNPTRFRCV